VAFPVSSQRRAMIVFPKSPDAQRKMPTRDVPAGEHRKSN
jgi:hypothetical protein